MLFSVRMRAEGRGGRHVSGAEGIYPEAMVDRAICRYRRRALNHARGPAEKTVITVERLQRKPKNIPPLPVLTLDSKTPASARRIARDYLLSLDIAEHAIREAFRVLSSAHTMRGAALVDAADGRRLEPDPARGVRVSMLGLDQASDRKLRRRLAARAINTDTVREAIVLASKAASCHGVIAEICASDDPDYTTGYVASQAFGYVRLPNIKRASIDRGGRVLFIARSADLGRIIEYLERVPVLIA